MFEASKVCTKCGSEKPATLEHFYAHNEGKHGLRPDCRVCHGIRSKEYQERTKDRRAERGRLYRARLRAEGINRDKDYYEKNKARLLKQQAEYNRKNKDAYLARLRRWRKANPEKVNVWTRNRRAKIKGSVGSHSLQDIRALMSSQYGLCVYCKTDISASFHVDHIMPIARGGQNDPSNLQLLCKPCNLLKRDKLPSIFAQEIGAYFG